MNCSIEKCAKAAVARGWCTKHYARWLRHGDPNLQRQGTAPGEAQRFLKEVVLAYEGDDCLAWPYSKYRARSGQVHVPGGVASVPRLVCEHEHGPPPTPRHEAAHSCGNGHLSCVTRRHLSWKTPKENKADELIHGTRNFGERNGHSKLTIQDVRRIRALVSEGVMYKNIAPEFGVNATAISRIATGQRWGSVA